MSTEKQPGGLEPTRSSSRLIPRKRSRYFSCGYNGSRECGGVFFFNFSGDGCTRWNVSSPPGEEVEMKLLISCEAAFHLSGVPSVLLFCHQGQDQNRTEERSEPFLLLLGTQANKEAG